MVNGGKRMKKIVLAALILSMCISLCACGSSGETQAPVESGTTVSTTEATETPAQIAFKMSQEAYDSVSEAYAIVTDFAEDIYEAWRLGIHEDESITSRGNSYLASELNLSETELNDAITYFIAVDLEDQNWDTLTEQQKRTYADEYDDTLLYSFFEEDLFSFCTTIVGYAYIVNGDCAKVEDALNNAKGLMKEMSASYSDYEHYPSLKGYYTTVQAYFDFCQNPTGSFNQLVETDNTYQNDIRNYQNDLDFIFGD